MSGLNLAKVQEINFLDNHTVSVILTKPPDYVYQAGQYTHWTIPHQNTDNRGQSREFSFASAPEEPTISFLTRIPDNGSTYKQALARLLPGQPTYITAAQGKFLLPNDLSNSTVWFAGGVGIAPFRSFAKHLKLLNQPTDKIKLFFSNPDSSFPYLSDLSTINSTLTITRQVPNNWPGNSGHFTADLISKKIPNYQVATYFICGHTQMVLSILKLLTSDLKIKRSQINLDLFTGY